MFNTLDLDVVSRDAKKDFIEKKELGDKTFTNVSAAGCSWWNISCHLGNLGRFCTITKECMPSCHA